MPNTPLLLLLDGVLSQDEATTNTAMTEIRSIVSLPAEETTSPLTSGIALEDCVRQLLSKKPELARIPSDCDKSMPLHFAASIGNIPVARAIMEAYREGATTPNRKGKIPLHYAAREGRTEMVQFFMEEAPETAAVRSKKDKLALHFAAGEGHREVVRALLKSHPEGVSIRSKKGKVAVHFAARWNHVGIVQDLLDVAPGTVSISDYDGSCPLHDAAREGQLEMMKFLVNQYPQGLMKENLIGEIPLFPAIRSGNVELAKFMIYAWPRGGQHVLQRVRKDDNIHEWDQAMLELCLRGAVNVWDPETDVSENLTPDDAPKTALEMTSTARLLTVMKASSLETESTASSIDEASDTESRVRTLDLDINLPRSNSPILAESMIQCKKRQSNNTPGSNKRPRQEEPNVQTSTFSQCKAISEHKSFYELHAALACSAPAPVLECILDRHEEQLKLSDELGRFPLHVALEAPNSTNIVDTILERIWKPNKQACFERDFLGRLPLHHALMRRADPRIIKALLETNPKSGVEYTDMLDARFMEKLPIEMAMSCGCDLNTTFMLLRGDPSVLTNIDEWQ